MISDSIIGLVLLIVGILLLGLGAWAIVALIRDPLASRKSRILAWTLGILLGIIAAFITYPYSDTVKIFGFPFPAAAFKLEQGRWLDYVGSLTGPFTFGNFLVGLGLGHLIVLGTIRARRRKAAA